MSNSIEAQLHSAFTQHAAKVSEEAVTRLRRADYGPRRSSTGGILVGVGVAAALAVGAGVVATDGTTIATAATTPTPGQLEHGPAAASTSNPTASPPSTTVLPSTTTPPSATSTTTAPPPPGT